MHDRVQITTGPGKAKQEFKDECDINRIMAGWRKTGVASHENYNPPNYGDYSNVQDYLDAQLLCKEADSRFKELTSDVRDRMGNDPATLLAFMADPANQDEAVALGLAEAPPKPPREPPPNVPDDPPAEPPPE